MTDSHAAQRTKVVAFYSLTNGIGRSCMIANIALILASYGYRVLVIDHDLAEPSLDRYLAAFLPGSGAGPGAAPIRLTCRFADPRGAVDLFEPVRGSAAPADVTVSRASLVTRGYDFALVDMPSGTESVALTGELADILVLGYSPRRKAADNAAQFAREIRAGRRGEEIRILPVPMNVDYQADAVARMLTRARFEFSRLNGTPDASRQDYWTEVGIPYEPDYALSEGLAYLDDPSGQRDRLVSAYARLAAHLAPGPGPAIHVAVADQTRARYRAARRAAAGDSAAVTVLHAPEDQYWAEWIVSQLQGMELTATRRRIGQARPASVRSASALLVVSASLLADTDRDEHAPAVTSQPPEGREQLGVSVDGTRLPPGRFPAIEYADLAGKDAEQAYRALAFACRVPGTPGPDYRLRYPDARRKPTSRLPDRDGTCRGRDDEIDMIRDHFTSRENPVPLTLTGPPGIGKSRLALEYAHRFADSYDLVFRIQADSAHAIRADLDGLAATLQIRRPGGDAGLSVLRYLQARNESAPEHWLLIYDDADVAGALDGLLPGPGHGHVLITARAPVADLADTLTVTALSPDSGAAVLSDLVPGILPGEATAVVNALGGVPLGIRLAGAWLGVVVRQLLAGGISPATVVSYAAREFGQRFAAELGNAAPADRDPVRVVVGLLLLLLASEEHGAAGEPHRAAALELLETCAFLAPAGLPNWLLRSPAMLSQLIGADAGVTDPVVVNNVVRTLASYGFSGPGLTARDPVRIDPRVREFLRDRMSPEDRATRIRAVTRMLAASAPPAIDDDVAGNAADTGVYSELLRHMEPSGALEETDAHVRDWLVNQVRFLWQLDTAQTWRTARELGESLARRWAAKVPDKDDDPLLLRLRAQLANVYRSQGDFPRARAIDRDVLSRQRRVLGLGHLRTLMTARSYAADLRRLGEFEAALDTDQSTWRQLRSTLGDDHLLTIVASNNMTLSEVLCGYPEQALDRQRKNLTRCERIRSERPWQRPWVLASIGTIELGLGLYEESLRSLEEARLEFRDLVSHGTVAPTSQMMLRTTARLAMTRRRLGMPATELTRETLDAWRDTYGDLSPGGVLTLELSLAGDLHATGSYDEAAERAGHARDGLGSVFGPEHPFTRICEVDLSIYALAAGHTRKADEMGKTALEALETDLNQGHPWLLAARVARANVLAAIGRPGAAQPMEHEVLEEYRRRFGQSSPFTRTVAINAANTRMLLHEHRAIPDFELEMNRRAAIELDIPLY